MAKKNQAVGHVDISTFDVSVYVFRDFKSYRAEYRRAGVKAPEPGKPTSAIAAWADGKNGRLFSMVVPDACPVKTIVHEASHAADFVLDHVGVPLGVQNTEIRAYLTAHIFDETMRILGRYK